MTKATTTPKTPPTGVPDAALLTRQARHVRYPPTLQYVTFNTYFRQVRDEYDAQWRATIGEAKRSGAVNPQLPAVLRARLAREFAMADAFAQASIYYVTREVAQTMLDAARRLAERSSASDPLPLPDPPITPLWIEFAPDATLGDNTMSIRGLLFRKIAALAPVDPATGALTTIDDATIRNNTRGTLDHPRVIETTGYEVTFIDDDVGTKIYRYGPGLDGVWVLEQAGPCEHTQTCPIARRTRRGVPYSVHQTLDAETVFPPNSERSLCACYDAGSGWSVLLYTLLNLLLAEGVTHTTVHHAAQVDSDHLPNHVRREAQRAAAEWNGAFARRYVQLSISQRLHHIRVTRRPGDAPHAQLVDADDAETTRINVGVPTHYRLLIPGPTKPWRGDRPRIVPVRSYRYERRARHETRSRTIHLVTP